MCDDCDDAREVPIAERLRLANEYLAEVNAIRLLCGSVAVRDGKLVDTRTGGVLAHLSPKPENDT